VSALAPVLERYFSEHLPARRLSPHTVEAYRDAFCLLLAFSEQRLHRRPSELDLSELDEGLVMAFLEHLETERHNGVVTRNLRLAAIHGFFAYAALRCPEHAASIGRVLAVPRKRSDHKIVSFLTRPETEALLSAPPSDSLLGRRDRTLLAIAVQTGLRVSELTGLRCCDVTLAGGPSVRCLGKGRRERATPLTASNVRLLRSWMAERAGGPDDALFPTRAGGPMSSDAVTDLVAKYVARAAESCQSLGAKHVTPHTLRHTAPMRLIEAGVDTATIALWLGHASIRSTAVYTHADLAMVPRRTRLASVVALAGNEPRKARRYAGSVGPVTPAHQRRQPSHRPHPA
jgi:integrase/recombinase XerD